MSRALPKISREEMIAAMRGNDAAYDGRFYVGVHSTGIYCLPSCRAKLPKIENVVFYASREEAIAAGLRGCKRCRSERFPDVLPEWLHQVLAYMQQHKSERLTEEKLIRLSGVDISTVRHYFREHVGMTPLAFHRRIRLQHARALLCEGWDYLSAAYECGYQSASGFRDAYTREFGTPPRRLHGHQ
ncbi:helix-turn-helix domain-containing protein [candidate division GN15 bacterium]|nr:helix-turn-helix domain-containing protein [candidate division GN15 bacterium]